MTNKNSNQYIISLKMEDTKQEFGVIHKEWNESKSYAECYSKSYEDWMDNTSLTSNEIDFDIMEGHEFEEFCKRVLEMNGFEDIILTPGSGDQGIDIIAYKDDIKYGIQCKCYSSDIGNWAVQEVFAGKTYHQCHVGVVLTNRYFTKSAIELAAKNGIVLWNRERLLKLLKKWK